MAPLPFREGFGTRNDLSPAEARRRRGMTENEIGTIIVDTAIALHRDLGPGLLEMVYRVVMEHDT